MTAWSRASCTSSDARHAKQADGWEPTTKLVGDRLFVVDERDVPEEIYKRASGDTADACSALARRRTLNTRG